MDDNKLNGAAVLTSEPFVAELSQILLGRESLDELLDRVARLAQRAIPGADQVSVTLVRDDRARTAAFTGEPALQLDERQYDKGYGPCLDAAATGQTITIEDTSSGDDTYPDFAAAAHRAGVRRTLSMGMPIPQRTVGALNIYGTGPLPFDEALVTSARGFAGYAAVALANAALYADTAQLAEQMQTALESRAVIEQAKGILIRDNRCSADEAFAMLRQASNRSNRKLNELARSIVETTERGA